MTLPPAITSRTNARVKALRAALNGRASQPGELVGIEGEHLLREALISKVALQTVYIREGNEAALQQPSLSGLRAFEIVILGRDAFDSAVHTSSPQGVAATFAIPTLPFLQMRANPGMFLFVEDLQDPGNLGTLIRSAEAFGVRRVIATPATVNAWNPKTMRASAGSIFRVPVLVSSLREFATDMRWGGIKMIAAVVRGDGAKSVLEVDLHAPAVLMIGNEGAGLSADALALANERVHIPCAVESLNAAIAGSMLMYEASRQNRQLFAEGLL